MGYFCLRRLGNGHVRTAAVPARAGTQCLVGAIGFPPSQEMTTGYRRLTLNDGANS